MTLPDHRQTITCPEVERALAHVTAWTGVTEWRLRFGRTAICRAVRAGVYEALDGAPRWRVKAFIAPSVDADVLLPAPFSAIVPLVANWVAAPAPRHLVRTRARLSGATLLTLARATASKYWCDHNLDQVLQSVEAAVAAGAPDAETVADRIARDLKVVPSDMRRVALVHLGRGAIAPATPAPRAPTLDAAVTRVIQTHFFAHDLVSFFQNETEAVHLLALALEFAIAPQKHTAQHRVLRAIWRASHKARQIGAARALVQMSADQLTRLAALTRALAAAAPAEMVEPGLSDHGVNEPGAYVGGGGAHV